MCDLIFITSVLSALQAQSYHLTGRPDLTLPHSPQVWESMDSRIPENFAFGIRNPWLWTPEYSSRNTERNPESTVRKSECKTVLVYLTWGSRNEMVFS